MTVRTADVTAPGSVTGLTAGFNPTSIELVWDNPANADFTGVLIRRTESKTEQPTAPATVTDGTKVTDWPAPEIAFTDTGLAPDTFYTYALFAHDGAGNFAAAATTDTKTNALAGRTDAILSVSVLGVPSNTLTVDALATFDASSSIAKNDVVPPETLVSGTLDYGDGTTADEFTGPVSGWNISHAYTTPGSKTVTLTVTDSAGTIASTTVTLTVVDAPPTGAASISVTSGPVKVGEAVTFALGAPAGMVFTSYDLIFNGPEQFFVHGDTAPPAAVTIEPFIFDGTYTVVFRVQDGAGGSTFAQMNVVVAP